MCLVADTCLTADPGVASSIPSWSHIFVGVNHEIIRMANLLPQLIQPGVVVSYKQ